MYVCPFSLQRFGVSCALASVELEERLKARQAVELNNANHLHTFGISGTRSCDCYIIFK